MWSTRCQSRYKWWKIDFSNWCTRDCDLNFFPITGETQKVNKNWFCYFVLYGLKQIGWVTCTDAVLHHDGELARGDGTTAVVFSAREGH